jgi:diaminohydroxyphosphoribosylaminopyrimidine deaminase/5-amino-6-(5-phosphoribosylamino)uracil reductase
MQRCLQLAAIAAGEVSPNPMVGAVLVHEGRIIGEGWHRRFGGPHAEINCLDSVREADRHLIPQSTLFVSLEPCAHFGKTPPCSLRIIQERIPEVVIACRDPFPDVNGKGIEQLRDAGIRVITGVLDPEARFLNRRFFTRHTLHRPYIILKWAETADGKIAGPGGTRLYISNEATNRLVHRWRGEEAAIMVGSETVLSDDPMLTNRLWKGAEPVRIVTDRQLRLPPHLKIFKGDVPTLVLNTRQEKIEGNLQYIRIPDGDELGPVLKILSDKGIQSILVEGGAKLISSFMRQGYFDEIRRIVSGTVLAPRGIDAPWMGDGKTGTAGHIPGDGKEDREDEYTGGTGVSGEGEGASGGYFLERVQFVGSDRIEYFMHGKQRAEAASSQT